MKRVTIHLGHGKTGTSALQTILAKNHENLKDKGVLYPYHPSFEQAKKGWVSAGNINTDIEGWAQNLVSEIVEKTEYKDYIFSSEVAFWKMDGAYQFFKEISKYIHCRFIICVREPIEMVSSAYMQAVKRAGYIGSVTEFISKEHHLSQASHVLRALSRNELDVTVINYSSDPSSSNFQILDAMEVLQLIDLDLPSAKKIVNRSLTQSELMAIRFINKFFGPSIGREAADALVNMLPDVKADKILIPYRDQIDFIEKVRPAADEVNNYLPKNQRLQLVPQSEENVFYDQLLEEDQASVIKGVLSKYINN
ncbi:hypothetical protein [Paracoccus haeundaensis]|uniref:Sulfotransferase domain-containing protein n=1 Tax=Paracoccus haeundaensis TaxID=225362 RepID=A0A5C4R1F2_9RHOB|nr:hypothetical protein [Paracoccus haeundaensis]TNH37805.1 hypothetical protein FHD67_18220 [Paracoccus haeundaensis]